MGLCFWYVEYLYSVENKLIGTIFGLTKHTLQLERKTYWVTFDDYGIPCSWRGWPSTQPNRIIRGIAANHWAAHNPTARWCAGSIVCNFLRQQSVLAQRCPNVDTIMQRWANVSPTYIADWLGCEEGHPYGRRTQTSQHTTETQGCVQLRVVLLGV